MPLSSLARVRRHNRPSGHTGRLWSVRTQLLAPILVATSGLLVLGAIQTGDALAASTDAERARVLAGTATATVSLVHELERELGETAALRQRGGTSGRQLVDAQRRRVDEATARYASASADARRAAPDLGRALDGVTEHLNQLDEARVAALGADTADPAYVALVESLLAVADALPAQLRDPELANRAREVAAVAAEEHLASLERDLLRAVFVRGTLAEGELARLGRLRGAQEQRQAEFSRIAGDRAAEAYTRLLGGSDVSTARRMRDSALNADTEPAALAADGDAWYVAQSGAIRRFNLLGRELSDELDRRAVELAADARQRALVTGGSTGALALASLVTAALLAVRTSRRLRRLRVAALTMAHRELPERITAISAGDGGRIDGPASQLTAGISHGRDEIAQVAEAFDTVNRAALRLAGEQAELRMDVTRMVEALARRIRTLITRQLRLLDDFERDETDPDALARLFALDHLAARMRRNGENLLVLSGGEPGRTQEGPHLLADVVRGAASEIEEYARIEINVPTAAVHGSAVGNLVHLLAELLENATAYSPPHAPVHVDGRRTVDGLTLRVHDQGIGIRENRLAEINQRLGAPAVLSSAAAGSMGLHVVAHLANRHGIRVRLHSTGAGTVAQVDVPEAVLTRVEEVTGRPVIGARSTPSAIGTWFRHRSAGSGPGAPSMVEVGAGPNRFDVNGAPTMTLPVVHVAAETWPPAQPGQPQPGQPQSWPPAQAGQTPSWSPASAPANGQPAWQPGNGAAGAKAGAAPAGLPRRVRGDGLQAELHDVPPPQPGTDLLDPEVVRARLSALSAGVAHAMRRNQQTNGRP
ncbi:nitrate- and nitrite sensing domain-containing protein [Micromonospora sp. WMMD1082]|uniref:sensor histidine kinase n=1 Tax=Micromonospora sp. WMMD1082 TaxID=3016104 RepID=UPI0024170C91|nr:nitrate- and nitrite sensing domain-containing protein [Micromonospora sp. WMMD1082]MDG4796268.1 nitrate- and nitrite sensing domain-containing protein [Micromonospora sp. WMMD1082]